MSDSQLASAELVRVVDGIRDAIVQGDLVAGQRLIEGDLAVTYSVSRAVVRTALFVLAHEGLIERQQNRGAIVRTLSIDEAIEITELRMVIEALCARKAAELATESDVAEIRGIAGAMSGAYAAGDHAEYSHLNHHLHSRIREISGHRTASVMLDRLRGQAAQYQRQLSALPGRSNLTLPEHLAIAEAICARSPEDAERAMIHHLTSLVEALKLLKSERARPAARA